MSSENDCCHCESEAESQDDVASYCELCDQLFLVLHAYILSELLLGCKHSQEKLAKTFGDGGFAVEQLQESSFDLGVELLGFDAFFAFLHVYIRDHFGLFVNPFSCFFVCV